MRQLALPGHDPPQKKRRRKTYGTPEWFGKLVDHRQTGALTKFLKQHPKFQIPDRRALINAFRARGGYGMSKYRSAGRAHTTMSGAGKTLVTDARRLVELMRAGILRLREVKPVIMDCEDLLGVCLLRQAARSAVDDETMLRLLEKERRAIVGAYVAMRDKDFVERQSRMKVVVAVAKEIMPLEELANVKEVLGG